MDETGKAGPEQIEILARQAAAGGQVENDTLIRVFLDTVVIVPSGNDPSKLPLAPVLVQIDDVPHMVVCASLEAARQVGGLAPYAASMRGLDVVRGVAPGYALLVRTAEGEFAIERPLIDEIRLRQRL